MNTSRKKTWICGIVLMMVLLGTIIVYRQMSAGTQRRTVSPSFVPVAADSNESPEPLLASTKNADEETNDVLVVQGFDLHEGNGALRVVEDLRSSLVSNAPEHVYCMKHMLDMTTDGYTENADPVIQRVLDEYNSNITAIASVHFKGQYNPHTPGQWHPWEMTFTRDGYLANYISLHGNGSIRNGYVLNTTAMVDQVERYWLIPYATYNPSKFKSVEKVFISVGTPGKEKEMSCYKLVAPTKTIYIGDSGTLYRVDIKEPKATVIFSDHVEQNGLLLPTRATVKTKVYVHDDLVFTDANAPRQIDLEIDPPAYEITLDRDTRSQ